MDIVDRELEDAERDASPGLFPPATPHHLSKPLHEEAQALPEHELGQTTSNVSSSSSSTSNGSLARRTTGHLSRLDTQRDIERHPTAISRIRTGRDQHAVTVGRSNTLSKSRTQTRDERRPLPPMGHGKPYPAPLPDREEYVVEFDGPEDPLHPQNWSMRKK